MESDRANMGMSTATGPQVIGNVVDNGVHHLKYRKLITPRTVLAVLGSHSSRRSGFRIAA